MTALFLAIAVVGWLVAFVLACGILALQRDLRTLDGYNRILAAIIAGRVALHEVKRITHYDSVDDLLTSLDEEGR